MKVIQLKRHTEGEDVKTGWRLKALESNWRVKVSKKTLAQPIGEFIDEPMDDLKPQIGHAHVIGVRID
jgi:hypothetical protein